MDGKVYSKSSGKRAARIRRYFYNKLFPKRQNPTLVALSVAVGIFIGILPTWGFALVLTIAVLALLRLPKPPGVIASFIAIPPTLLFFFYPLGFAVGKILLPPPAGPVEIMHEIVSVNLNNYREKFAWFFGAARPYFVSFMVGTAVVAFVMAILGGVLTWGIMEYRRGEYVKQKHLKQLAKQGNENEDISV